MFTDADVISRYTVQQGIADGILVEIFKTGWSVLSGGKPIVATARVFEEFTSAALVEVWNEYIDWRKTVQPTLPTEEDLFATTVNNRTVWVLEDGDCFTILFPDDY